MNKIEKLKELINSGNYDWQKAIEDTANKIINYPQALLWR